MSFLFGSPPKPKKVNAYKGVEADPDVFRAMGELGINKVDSDKEMRQINQFLLDEKIKQEKQNNSFKKAFRQLKREGIIDKDAARTEADLELIYQRQLDNKTAKLNAKEEKRLADYQVAQEQAAADQAAMFAQQQQDFVDSQAAASKQAAEDQEAMLDALLNQPIYSPRQASLPPVQPPPEELVPIPQAPVPKPLETIDPPPPPELVQTQDNNLVIVQQQQSARDRQQRASRGTSSLIN